MRRVYVSLESCILYCKSFLYALCCTSEATCDISAFLMERIYIQANDLMLYYIVNTMQIGTLGRNVNEMVANLCCKHELNASVWMNQVHVTKETGVFRNTEGELKEAVFVANGTYAKPSLTNFVFRVMKISGTMQAVKIRHCYMRIVLKISRVATRQRFLFIVLSEVCSSMLGQVASTLESER